MPSIRRQGSRYEIRECRSTDKGPRQFTLARFSDVLTPEVVEEAAARAHRPFDVRKLLDRARDQGIAVSTQRKSSAARRLLAELRSGHALEPGLVELLRQALAPLDARPLPEHLVDAADWLGQPDAARGKGLRGLLRAASRTVRARGPLRMEPPEPFPRFSSVAAARSR